MAAYELDKVTKVQTQLQQMGHTLPDAPQLLADADRRLKLSKQLWDNHSFPEAYHEAQRALRPVRILMRAQWEKAVRGTDSPVASPYTASFFTLPQHWQFMAQIDGGTWGDNVLPGGDFESLAKRPEDAWHIEDPPSLDGVELIAQRVSEVNEPKITTPGIDPKKPTEPDTKKPGVEAKNGKQPDAKKTENAAKPSAMPTGPPVTTIVKGPAHEGKLCAMLKIQPKANKLAPVALERTLLALNSPVVHLQPGTIVRISGWVCIPTFINASPDGALLYDSAGGDAMAVRLLDQTAWKKFTLYRRVPASGMIQMTLALTGLGTVYFDDIRIEPLVPRGANPAAAVNVVRPH
jgi:hypothetical protein